MIPLLAFAAVAVFGFAALAVDAPNLFVNRAQSQNAADRISLAVAWDLAAGKSAAEIQSDASKLSDANGLTSPMTPCTSGGDPNCYQTPYVSSVPGSPCDASHQAYCVQVRVQKSAPSYFARVLGFLGFQVSVSAVALGAPSVSSGVFAYAADPACGEGITLTAGSGDTFSAIWSNGGFRASGRNYVIGAAAQGLETAVCPYPSTLVPPTSPDSPTLTPTIMPLRRDNTAAVRGTVPAGATTLVVSNITGAPSGMFGPGQVLLVQGSPSSPAQNATVASFDAATRTITLTAPLVSAVASGVLVTDSDWPATMPPVPTTCTHAASTTIDSAWLNGATATLTAQVSDTTLTTSVPSQTTSTVLSVASTAGFVVNDVVQIGGEKMKIAAVGSGTLVVSRAQNGTAAAAHPVGANVGTTVLGVSSTTGFAAGDTVVVDGEYMAVAAVGGGSLTVTRGTNGSASASHASAAVVTDMDNPGHPPGVYCFTGGIVLAASFTGYEFVSRDSTAANAIKNDNGPYVWTNGTTSNALPMLYAVSGGIAITNPSQFVGQVFAPLGTITFTGGDNLDTGLMMAQDIVITNSGTTFIGDGFGGGATGASYLAE